MDVKEKVSTALSLVDSLGKCVGVCGCVWFFISLQENKPDFSGYTHFLAACAAWPAIQ